MTVRIGVMTSGGDAQGMNAAVRAIVRTGIHEGAEVFAIREGWQGAIQGGEHIVRLGWSDVSGILSKGGTVIGTARSAEFRTREGQLTAVANLIEKGIDRLIVIGGDGSLTGSRHLCLGWPEYVAELVEAGRITPEQAAQHPRLYIAGLVGSIDNDMVGTDMTIGTDSALHRITEAIDAISSTAESHRRTFIVEVMGRHCGYLALMSAIAGGADYTFLPESPPRPGWEDRMVDVLARGRAAGRRDSILIVAEGAADRDGTPITASRIQDVLRERTGEEARITILGHVQRGGTPSAYDRWMATACGVEAVRQVLDAEPDSEPVLVGVHRDAVHTTGLLSAVEATHRIGDYIASADYDAAVAARGHGFLTMIDIYRMLHEARPSVSPPETPRRIAVMHAGALAPGMNQLARVAVRAGLDLGYEMMAVIGGVPGLINGDLRQVGWSDVEGMAHTGGAAFGTRRYVPQESELYQMARSLEDHGVDALLVMGGFHAYATVDLMERERRRYPAFNIPLALLPASIDNNLPGWPMAVGADTALNTIVSSIDMVRMSASASKRAFVVETMGRTCGFLPLLGGIAGGAEKAYLPESGITLEQLSADIEALVDAFETGRSFYLAVMGEETSEHYTADVLARLFEAEGRGLYSVRRALIGHVQQGGTPSPFDRINATRLAYQALVNLDRQLQSGTDDYVAAHSGTPGLMAPLRDVTDHMDWERQRPREQWWLRLRAVFDQLSRKPGQE
ncbi:6-phosphofructokinase [Tessaracoccus lapidicaptus]|uniref:6-phosphofructokinase n=1 Tax=Tessaracoccus lapidicaptus TaxID=1427523 RepID=A0A1C0AK35_9ACTN|nr:MULTISPECIES: 6-phosphofructokinase [Tessaracoccus]AQX17040.1 6-phosphofructokinase [Tessaracoccus sp. T2.5-30]OCL32982.1 6-phosphofructokinase [Tessaracoccus lapidicaptus]VEP41902.1 ATP-dependent 6-phosphofructokinase [Tessaracoccus lapidicaptus]